MNLNSICDNCGKQFSARIRSYRPRRHNLFCSRVCWQDFRKKQKEEIRIKKICEHCGQIFNCPPWLLKLPKPRRRRFCSKECCRLHRSGENSPRWNGGLYFEKGYANLWIKGERKRRCRYIMETILGRELLSKETVHHRNGIKSDDRPENLELWSNSHPPGQRVVDKIKWARNFLEQYGKFKE